MQALTMIWVFPKAPAPPIPSLTPPYSHRAPPLEDPQATYMELRGPQGQPWEPSDIYGNLQQKLGHSGTGEALREGKTPEWGQRWGSTQGWGKLSPQ